MLLWAFARERLRNTLHRLTRCSRVPIAATVFLAGCAYHTSLSYQSMLAPADAPLAAVALEVVDARPAGYGGDEPARVGTLRGGYGNPFPLLETNADAVRRLIDEATTDALLQAGVGTQPTSGRKLVATVKNFWVDGFMGYKATVETKLELIDESKKVLWNAEVKGEAGGAAIWTPTGFVLETFQKALAEYAAQAALHFQSADFQRLVF